MKAVKGFKCFIGLFFLINSSQRASACDGKPVLHLNNMNYISTTHLQTDTLPPKVSGPDKADNKPVEAIIKVVPKARKQVVPIPVSIPVKPPVIIKPKIIKPVIKILH
jgi:hypothetical protein